ncbi:hypothetical protein Tco_0752577 [Tanacetum coccineum]|uniref:Uncharacterized protein n=1 Tax=Tanacetum coccineum TaxID=301880 RepID=A0ABQ4Z8Y1_9ASTR
MILVGYSHPISSTPLPPLKRLDDVEPVSGQKTIKSTLRSKSTFKAKTLKGVMINEPPLAPAKGNKSSSASKVNSAPAGKLKSVKIENDPPLAIVTKELNDIKLQISKNQSSYSRKYISTKNTSQHLKSLGRSSSRYKILRPSKRLFPPCIHYRCIDHLSNECLYYPICGLCGSYDHDTNGHNRIISLEREINPRNPQHAFKRCKAYGSLTHTIIDHYDIEWFKRGEALQAKKAEALKSTRAESSNANRSKTPTKRNSILVNFCDEKVDNINIAKNKRYPPDEYLHPYEPSQRYQINNNDVSFIEPYECPEPVVLETEVSFDQNGQTNQKDESVQNDAILNDGQSEHSNHTNDKKNH